MSSKTSDAKLVQEFRQWLAFWGGSAAGTIVLGTLLALAHRWASGG